MSGRGATGGFLDRRGALGFGSVGGGLGWLEKDSQTMLGGCSISRPVASGAKHGGVGE